MTSFEIDDTQEYEVDLARSVMRGPFKMLPRDQHKMQGLVLREIIDASGWEVIADVRPVA
jgi:hypothetical protein